MQTELKATYPLLDIEFVGVNWAGLEGNAQFAAGKSLPWLQDVDADGDGKSDAWTAWDVDHLDLVVLNGNSEPAGFTNLISYGLGTPENYTELREALIDIAMQTQRPWQNADDPLDVDDSGAVIPLDALIVINRLNSTGPEKLPPPTSNQLPPPYYDTNGDGELAPLDVLLVINYLNAQSAASAGEGEWFSTRRPQTPEDIAAAADVRQEGTFARAYSSDHVADRSRVGACGAAMESRLAESASDAARGGYVDRAFRVESPDWQWFSAALLDTDVEFDLLGIN